MAADLDLVLTRAPVMRGVRATYGAFICQLLFGPIVLLVLFSFNANRYGTFPITAWTLVWYRDVFNDFSIHDALSTSLRVGAEVTAISPVVGTAAAFPLVRSKLRFRDGIRIAFILPIMIPGLLIGV